MTDTGRVNSTPLHAVRPGARSLRMAAALAGGLAAVAAATVGTVALVRSPAIYLMDEPLSSLARSP